MYFNIAVKVNESCFFNEQCEAFLYTTECREGTCSCRFEMIPVQKDGKVECISKYIQLLKMLSKKNVYTNIWYNWIVKKLIRNGAFTKIASFIYLCLFSCRRTKEARSRNSRRSSNVHNFGSYGRHVYHNLCCLKTLQQVSN